MWNHNTEVESQAWDEGEPNGGEEENFVMIKVVRAVLNDVDQNEISCSACNLSSS